MEKNKRAFSGGIPITLSITGTYILFGLGWILLSDALLEFLVVSPVELSALQTIKGWFFIIATGIFLYFLLSRYSARIRFGEENFRKTVEEVKDYAVFALDKDGYVTTWNEGAEKLLYYKDYEIIGENYSVFFTDTDRRNNVPSSNLAAAVEGRYFSEGKRVKRDGTAFYAHSTMTSFKPEKNRLGGFLLIIHDVTEMKKTEETLMQNHAEIRGLMDHLESVREEERLNISREIHDELGQMLTSIKIDLSFVGKQLNANHLSESDRVENMKEKIDALIGSVRRIASDLRPYDIDVLGLEATIEAELESLRQRLGMEINFNSNIGGLVLNPKISIGAYRICQEAITNILKHSKASKIDVKLLRSENKFALTIEDNGKGFDTNIPIKSSFGIIGMKERATIMGGDLSIKSNMKGTLVKLVIPITNLS